MGEKCCRIYMMKENKKIEKLLKTLVRKKLFTFPQKGYTEGVGVPTKQGVYIIYSPQNIVVHVGRTQRTKRGLRQRLNNHLLGQSSFVKEYLKGRESKLRNGYKFRYLIVEDNRERVLLEALTIGKLCPKHLGLGDKTITSK